jgi:hypothetical protein
LDRALERVKFLFRSVVILFWRSFHYEKNDSLNHTKSGGRDWFHFGCFRRPVLSGNEVFKIGRDYLGSRWRDDMRRTPK